MLTRSRSINTFKKGNKKGRGREGMGEKRRVIEEGERKDKGGRKKRGQEKGEQNRREREMRRKGKRREEMGGE